MKVERHWMTKQLLKTDLLFKKVLLIFPILGLLSSCNPTELSPSAARNKVIANDGTMDNKALVYEDSPYIIGGPNASTTKVNMSPYLSRQAKTITTNNRLTGNCGMVFYSFDVSIQDCIHSLSKESATTVPLPRNADRTYIFPVNSSEFYQVNTLYHLSRATDNFFNKLNFAFEQAQTLVMNGEARSIPYYLMNSKLFWFKAMTSADRRLFNTDYLSSYSQCEIENNASFSPAGPSLCFGTVPSIPGFLIVQDPSVIYHELGHAFVSILMNLRNGTSSASYHPFRSNLGTLGYDEAGSLNEGIADYFSYMMNKRERFGEWAFGKVFDSARPLTEGDSLHSIPGLSETSAGRLSYPQYLLYNSGNPDEQLEDVHYAGQIVTHYLIALTKQLKTTCGYTSDSDGGHDSATSVVLLLLAETLSELGDLNAKGIDDYYSPLGGTSFFTNLDSTNSFLWTQYNNTVTYRRFFQTFGKNIYKYVSNLSASSSRVGLCPAFDKNISERLLDDYGLLLFKTYNDNGTSTKSTSINYGSEVLGMNFPVTATAISENNRRKSVLVSKQLIQLAQKTDTNPDRVGFYIIDNSSDIEASLKELLFKGFTVPISTNVAGTIYNNNNIKISPGEVVGIIPNLLNNSNSTMAGVQLLATDWDHVHIPTENLSTGNFKPCVVDTVTTVDQGGEAGQTCSSTDTNYTRLIKNSSSGLFPTSAAAPVCMVLLEEGDSAKWVSQNEFRKKQGLSLLDKDCLGYTTTTTSDNDFSFNPHECLVRFLPGANSAFFSKIDSQKTYYESVIKDSEVARFNMGNVLMMEVNKWIPPGTKFRCRMRARFSNCSDCYTDGSNSNDDFIDAEYNGSKPFKVINFEFDVND
jgi:hypothetical protein